MSERIYVNFQGQDPIEVSSMDAAWSEVKANPDLDLESIEHWHNDMVDDLALSQAFSKLNFFG